VEKRSAEYSAAMPELFSEKMMIHELKAWNYTF